MASSQFDCDISFRCRVRFAPAGQPLNAAAAPPGQPLNVVVADDSQFPRVVLDLMVPAQTSPVDVNTALVSVDGAPVESVERG